MFYLHSSHLISQQLLHVLLPLCLIHWRGSISLLLLRWFASAPLFGERLSFHSSPHHLSKGQSPTVRRTMGFILSDDTENDSPPSIPDDSPTSPSPLLRRARQIRQSRLRLPVREPSTQEEVRDPPSHEEVIAVEEKVFIPYRRRMFGQETTPTQSVAESKFQQPPFITTLLEDSGVGEEDSGESDAWSSVASSTLREKED